MQISPWYELVEVICIVVIVFLPILRLWPVVDRSSRAGHLLRVMWQRPYAAHALAITLGICVFFIVAEGILDADPSELPRRIDHLVHGVNQGIASQPLVRRAASIVSGLTGTGLVAAVLTGTVCLMTLRQRWEAVALVTGTAAAWLVSGLLKLGFGVVRPRSSLGYGFPSGHALVTVVGCGLLLWTLTQLHGGSPRFSRCCSGAIALGLIAGAARVVLDAHWVSDVIGGVAIGTVWLTVVVAVLSRYSGSRYAYSTAHRLVTAAHGLSQRSAST